MTNIINFAPKKIDKNRGKKWKKGKNESCDVPGSQ